MRSCRNRSSVSRAAAISSSVCSGRQRVKGRPFLLVQRGREEVRLAASFRGGGQFPLVPLFCFGTVGQIRGREYVIFLFDRQGTPKMPYNFGKGGKPKAVDQSR